MRPVISLIPGWRTLADLKSASQYLLQNRDLPGMIELVLGNAVKHVGKVVPLAGDAIAQAGIRQSGNDLDEPVVRSFRGGNGLAPGCLGRLGYGRKIIGAGGLAFLSTEPNDGRIVPGGDVQHELPYAVDVRERSGGSGTGIDVIQQLEERGAVPSLAIKGAAKLIGNERSFRGRAVLLHNCLFCHDRNPGCVRGIDYVLAIQEQAFPGIYCKAGGAGSLHHLDRLHPDHGHVEAHILTGLCDLDHG